MEATETETLRRQKITENLKNWMMAAMTLVFVSLYAAALFGWLKPLTDVTMVSRIEPIIFVIIGYYFGRLPAQQNEKTLKDEIKRQIHRADTIQQAKEKIHRERETLEEKIKNAKTSLRVSSSQFPLLHKSFMKTDDAAESLKESKLKAAIQSAINILES